MNGIPNKIKSIDIELTNSCNFKCSFCPYIDMERQKGMMSITLVKKLINEISEKKLSERVGMSQMGEPFLHPEIIDIVNYATERGINLHVITNGSLLSDKNLIGVMRGGLKSLLISYHTPDEKSFNCLRGTTRIDYFRYLEGIKRAIELKINKGFQTRIIINLMFSGDNPFRIPRVIDTFESLEAIINRWIDIIKDITGTIPAVPFRDFINKLKNEFSYYNYLEIFPGIEISVGLVYRWANWLLLNQGVNVKPSLSGSCNMVNERLMILWDGKCTLCCGDYDGKMVVGNANIESLEKIWCENAAEIRNGMKEHILINPLCQQCMGEIKYRSVLKALDYRHIYRILRDTNLRKLFFLRFKKRKFLIGL